MGVSKKWKSLIFCLLSCKHENRCWIIFSATLQAWNSKKKVISKAFAVLNFCFFLNFTTDSVSLTNEAVEKALLLRETGGRRQEEVAIGGAVYGCRCTFNEACLAKKRRRRRRRRSRGRSSLGKRCLGQPGYKTGEIHRYETQRKIRKEKHQKRVSEEERRSRRKQGRRSSEEEQVQKDFNFKRALQKQVSFSPWKTHISN